MSLIAVPNVSEGRDAGFIVRCHEALVEAGARVLDVHADTTHNRSVYTISSDAPRLANSLAALAEVAASIDLTVQEGVHPRLGGLDVCPIVPLKEDMTDVVEMARWAGGAIHNKTGLPIYFYGEAARRAETVELPALRNGGLERLMRRARTELPPDLGGREIDPRKGVVCVGARGPLIAFNVWLKAPKQMAISIANTVRAPNVRSLGFEIDADISQVSMNLTDPAKVGIDTAFGQVARVAERMGAAVVATEIVGLVEERFLPAPDARAARLLLQPSRSLESALA
ncbi:MAG: glutamate formiminotransferase / 5-formyltetrahydrofolate cyclo-ligase [Actinomycetota bacterium]|jgi:glutamate formiminotransferase|nr:glutamate formiminotransferase / 5-formyltetrahydrofolate cyclo-ligase [Actinomycetota bacterium]